MEIRNDIKDLINEVTVNRRHIHAHPEIGLETVNTRKYIVSKLKEYGFTIIEEGMAKNGVVAYLKVNDNKSSIAFRSDIDALSTKENTGLEFSSVNDNSHACGHDGHTAALLGLAKYLIEHKDQLNDNITFIFQPGEESPGGASLMINEGLFEKYPAKYIIGMHLMGDVDAGKIACKAGPLMARNGEVDIEIIGKSAHGAMPHLGKDAIIAGSELIMKFQEIKTANDDPMARTILTIGSFNGGTVRNVVCDKVLMSGTMRSFNDDLYEELKANIYRVSKEVASKYDLVVNTVVEDYYLVVDNDEYLNNLLKEAVGEDFVEANAKMIAEDFSLYQQVVPGLFYNCGIRDDKHQANIHDSNFDFDEAALLNGIETNVRLLEKLGVFND